MTDPVPGWPYLPTLTRLGLAIGLGLLVGIERERRGKEAGVRTFAFAALLGAAGGLLGETFALAALALLGVVAILLTVETIRTGEGAEITTTGALFVTGFVGVLAGQGHTFTPTAVAIVSTALLAWKKPMRGFIHGVTEAELKSALQLAIIAFVVYPVLPAESMDPWHLIYPRDAWITVILIASLGFVSYLLLKRYGACGLEIAGFLGGLVNSTVAVTEIASRAHSTDGRASNVTFRGVLFATVAMLIRNGVILGLLAPSAMIPAASALGPMIVGTLAAAWLWPQPRHDASSARSTAAADTPMSAPMPALQSPFSLRSVLTFGIVFLALQVLGTLAERAAGRLGFYVVSATGGLVSSASAVASAANLARSHTIPPEAAAIGAVLASLASTVIDLPVIARVGHDRLLTRRVAWALSAITLLGVLGLGAQAMVVVRWQ